MVIDSSTQLDVSSSNKDYFFVFRHCRHFGLLKILDKNIVSLFQSWLLMNEDCL